MRRGQNTGNIITIHIFTLGKSWPNTASQGTPAVKGAGNRLLCWQRLSIVQSSCFLYWTLLGQNHCLRLCILALGSTEETAEPSWGKHWSLGFIACTSLIYAFIQYLQHPLEASLISGSLLISMDREVIQRGSQLHMSALPSLCKQEIYACYNIFQK